MAFHAFDAPLFVCSWDPAPSITPASAFFSPPFLPGPWTAQPTVQPSPSLSPASILGKFRPPVRVFSSPISPGRIYHEPAIPSTSPFSPHCLSRSPVFVSRCHFRRYTFLHTTVPGHPVFLVRSAGLCFFDVCRVLIPVFPSAFLVPGPDCVCPFSRRHACSVYFPVLFERGHPGYSGLFFFSLRRSGSLFFTVLSLRFFDDITFFGVPFFSPYDRHGFFFDPSVFFSTFIS